MASGSGPGGSFCVLGMYAEGKWGRTSRDWRRRGGCGATIPV